MVTKKEPKRADLFNCNICDFICYKKSAWERHLSTSRHKNVTNVTEKEPKKNH